MLPSRLFSRQPSSKVHRRTPQGSLPLSPGSQLLGPAASPLPNCSMHKNQHGGGGIPVRGIRFPLRKARACVRALQGPALYRGGPRSGFGFGVLGQHRSFVSSGTPVADKGCTAAPLIASPLSSLRLSAREIVARTPPVATCSFQSYSLRTIASCNATRPRMAFSLTGSCCTDRFAGLPHDRRNAILRC
jgi:hypothetical protein